MIANMTILSRHLPLAVLLLASGLASQAIQATLVARQPIVLRQNGGSQISHPAGPLTAANLLLGPSFVAVNLMPRTLGWNLESHLFAGFPATPQSYFQASANLELSLSTATPTRAILRLDSLCKDDSGGSIAVNVPGYGSISFASGSSTGERHVDHFLVDLSSTPLVIAINQHAGGWPAGTCYLSADVELLSPVATPVAAGCGGLFVHGQSIFPDFQTDHFLDFVDNGSPTSSGMLRARALGQWSSFLLGFSAAQLPLQLPAPFATTCPTLANVVATSPGTVTNTLGMPIAWQLPLPLLPAGLTIYVQHACAKVPQQGWPGNIQWNTSNVLRIDT